MLDARGEILARLGEQSYGDAPGRFYSPHGIDVDSHGNIYVAEVAFSEYGRSMDPPRELRSLQQLVPKSSMWTQLAIRLLGLDETRLSLVFKTHRSVGFLKIV